MAAAAEERDVADGEEQNWQQIPFLKLVFSNLFFVLVPVETPET